MENLIKKFKNVFDRNPKFHLLSEEDKKEAIKSITPKLNEEQINKVYLAIKR